MSDSNTSVDDAIDDDDSVTSSTKARWTYLGSIMALVVICSFIWLLVASAHGKADLERISQPWFILFSTVVTAAVGWVFGVDLYKKYKSMGK